MLTSLLTSGYGAVHQLPAMVAPPHYLALLSTLTVHPTLTTRAKTAERMRAGSSALRYLRLVLDNVGPMRGKSAEAFSFVTPETKSRRGGRRRNKDQADSPEKGDENVIDNDLANSGALWAHAEDFWHVVGWAFNCSVLHQRRWEAWETWLMYMIEVLEADWGLRLLEDTGSLEESLIIRYITAEGATRPNERRVLRAVFANGSKKSENEFGEVWRNETKELKKDGEIQRPEKRVDIDANNYGDYLDGEQDDELESSSQTSSHEEKKSPSKIGQKSLSNDSPIPNGADLLGGMESIALRVRLLSLLSKVSAVIPESFIHTKGLYDLYLDHIRPLPLPTFFIMMSPLGLRHFTLEARSALTQYILRTMIASTAPEPPSDYLDQDVLGHFYLPFPANSTSTIDNTKVSLCVETLLRLLDKHAGLEWTPELHAAAEKGIHARKTKAKKVQYKRGTDGDGSADGMWLRGSAERIRMVLKMAKPELEEMEDLSQS